MPRDSNMIRAYCLVASLASCGPDAAEEPTWILGTFSSGNLSVVVSGVSRYNFFDDNQLVIENEAHCESEPNRWIMLWTPQGNDAVALKPAPGEEPFPSIASYKDIILRRDGTCGPYYRQGTREDGSSVSFELQRGSLCTQRLPPCSPPGSQCDECMLVWCDDEPAACEEE